MKKRVLFILFLLVLVGCENNVTSSNKPVTVEETNISNLNTTTDDQSDIEVSEEAEVVTDSKVTRHYEYYRVLSDSLNVRENPNENSKVVSQLSEDYVFYIIDKQTDDLGRIWFQESESKGWVASWYCNKITLYPTNGNTRYYIVKTIRATNIYEQASSDSEVLQNVYSDVKFRIIDTYIDDESYNFWYKVISKEGHIGWIEGKDCSEFSSDDGRRIEVMNQITTLSKEYQRTSSSFDIEQYISFIVDSLSDVKHQFTYDHIDYVIFGFSKEEVVYVFIYKKSDNIFASVGSSDYLEVKAIYLGQYLELDYSNGYDSGIKVIDLNTEKSLEDYITLNFIQSQVLESNKALLLEVIETENDLSDLRSIYYYNLTTSQLIPFKLASNEVEWTFSIDENMITVFKLPLNNKSLEKLLFIQEDIDYWEIPIEPFQPYITSQEFEQYFKDGLNSFTEQDIREHVELLEEKAVFTAVNEYDASNAINSAYLDEDYLYFEIKYYKSYYDFNFEGYPFEAVVLKWRKNSGEYELIPVIDYETYFSKLDTKGSKEEIIEYTWKSILFTRDKAFYKVYELGNYYIVELIDYSFDMGADFFKLMIIEKDGNIVFSESSYNQLEEIINETIIVRYYDFGFLEYQFYNLSLLNDKQDFSIKVKMNKYNRIPNTDWLILETAHPYPEGHWTSPNVTDVEFMNTSTNMIVSYKEHDLNNDYLYFMNEEMNVIEIYMKRIGEEEYGPDPMEVIEIDNIQSFLDELSADAN